jgi:glycine oxidase
MILALAAFVRLWCATHPREQSSVDAIPAAAPLAARRSGCEKHRMSSRDVVVVGGGIMGCGVALRLAQAGVDVTVLERAIPGAEASSAAAGILAPQAEAEKTGPFLDLCLQSRALYPSFSEELRELSGVDVQYLPCGAFEVAFTEEAMRHLESTVAWQRAAGLRAEILDGASARALEPNLSPGAAGVAHFPDDHQVDNRLLVRALSIAAARAGVQFRTGYVRGLEVKDDRVVGVDLDGEKLSAGAVVVAAGSWSSLVQGARIDPQAVRPVRGQLLELQLRLPPVQRVLFSERKGYLVPRRDGRVIAGSTMEFAGYDKQVTASGMARILEVGLEMCPALRDAQVLSFWAGLRPYTEDRMPLLGPGPLEGLFLATGHFRNGILLAPITALVIAEAVLGQTPSVDLSSFRYDRRPAVR